MNGELPKGDNSRDTLEQFIAVVVPQLEAIRSQFEAFCNGEGEPDALDEIRRITHRIKGEGAMAGFAGFSHIAAFQEELIDQLGNSYPPDTDAVNIVWRMLVGLETFTCESLDDDVDETIGLNETIKAYRRYMRLPEEEDAIEIEKLLHDQLPHKYSRERYKLCSRSDSRREFRQEVADHLQIVLTFCSTGKNSTRVISSRFAVPFIL